MSFMKEKFDGAETLEPIGKRPALVLVNPVHVDEPLPPNQITLTSETTPIAGLPALVLSSTPGVAEKVAQSLRQEGDMQAVAVTQSIMEYAANPQATLVGKAALLFEIAKGDNAQLAALRRLRAIVPETVKFIGLTHEVLNLTHARDLMEAGVDDVLPLSMHLSDHDPDQPVAQVENHTVKERAGRPHNGMIIGVTQTCGGIGATTFALNLAAKLSMAPKAKRKTPAPFTPDVAIVDLDLQNGMLAARIDTPDSDGMIELLREGIVPNVRHLPKLMQKHDEGFDVLPAPSEFVPLDVMRPEMIAALLDELRLAYDFIILDLPRTMVDWLDPVLVRLDKLYMLTDTAVHSIRQARRMIDFFSEDHVALPLEILISREKKPRVSSPAVKEAERFLNRSLSHWLPRDDRIASLATDRGQSMIAVDRKCAMAKAMAPLLSDLATYYAADARRTA